MDALMRLRKKELISMINRLQDERDSLFDETQRLKEDIEETETYEDEFHQLEELKDCIDLLKISKERHFLGVATALEDIENLTDKILSYAN